MDTLLWIAVAVLATLYIVQVRKNKKLELGNNKLSQDALDLTIGNRTVNSMAKDMQAEITNLQDELGEEREKNRALLSQKKSSETRLGQISEHIVPFLDACPYDPKNLHFLGNPIDYVCFDFDQGSITFLEVKSGNSKPSKRQKTVKNIIKAGRVFYDEIRINEKGVRIKNYQNADMGEMENTDEGEDDVGQD
jgi:predicted Holliday junction resolvase-like endonuclease